MEYFLIIGFFWYTSLEKSNKNKIQWCINLFINLLISILTTSYLVYKRVFTVQENVYIILSFSIFESQNQPLLMIGMMALHNMIIIIP